MCCRSSIARSSGKPLPATEARQSRGLSIGRASIGQVKRQEQWQLVLATEVRRWEEKSCEQLLFELQKAQAYQVEYAAKEYCVEVELLEKTEKYLHVLVSVDDGRLPASLWPLSQSFIRRKNHPGSV